MSNIIKKANKKILSIFIVIVLVLTAIIGINKIIPTPKNRKIINNLGNILSGCTSFNFILI